MDAAEAPTFPQDLVFVDLETTGCNPAHHRVTEIGIVRVQNGSVIEEWSSLVNPQCRIPSSIEGITGISNEMVTQAPRFADLAPLVLEKLGRGTSPATIFVAHNARFDYAFLRAEFRRLDVKFSAPVLCTVKLSRRLYPEHLRHGLDAVMERHGLVCRQRHRAFGDARVLADFWFKLLNERAAGELAAAAHALLTAHRLPAYLPEGLADELPEGPGVYRFFDENDALLYVGKSNALRPRILSHFSGAAVPGKEQKIGARVRRIDWRETAGELGAALLETAWIRAQAPRHNRGRKDTAEAVTIELDATTGVARFESLADLDAAALQDARGMFHSARDARRALVEIARAQRLCLKLLGVEPSEGSCVAHPLGQCKGACVGEEPVALHKLRVQMALASLKLKSWPFPGRVALCERTPTGETELHVVENWAYLGTAYDEEELEQLAAQAAPLGFDSHVYRVLQRFFANHAGFQWHDLRDRTQIYG